MFSVDGIIKKARRELNAMLTSINSDAERNIRLIDDRINQLKIVSADAESRVKLLKEEIARAQQSVIDRVGAEESLFNDDSQNIIHKNQLKFEEFEEEEKKVPEEINREIPENTSVSDNTHQTYKEKVKELAALGMTIDEIAQEVGRSTQEVKFTLEIS